MTQNKHPSQSAASMPSLAGLKVIDLSRVLGGPYCSQVLADHGADVIKIEPPSGDETREWGPPFSEGLSAYYAGANRNKRGLSLNLSQPEGREVLFRLLNGADVLLENFKDGTLEKWGLGYEAVLRSRFPRLIHARLSGFGGSGPLQGLPGYDAAVQAWTGLMSINGSPDSGPLRMGLPLLDLGAGLFAAIGILAALHERERSGQGQSVQTSLFETGLALLHPHAANWFMSGAVPKATGSAHPNIAPYELFQTHTGPVFLAVGNDRQFSILVHEIGAPELAKEDRYRRNQDRLKNREALHVDIESRLVNEDGRELCERLLRAGVPAGPVLNVAEAFSHEQARACGMVVECEGWKGSGVPVKMSRTPGSVRHRPERLNESAESILAEAGFTPDEVSALQNQGVVGRA